jgi:hypothetical protein
MNIHRIFLSTITFFATIGCSFFINQREGAVLRYVAQPSVRPEQDPKPEVPVEPKRPEPRPTPPVQPYQPPFRPG